MALNESIGNSTQENKRNFWGKIKGTYNTCLEILGGTFVDEEIGVDVRSKAYRHFQGTGEMYDLEMENVGKDIKYFIDKSNENDGIKN